MQLRFGETLDEVARARGIAVRELRRLNGVKDSAELRAGTAIVVPRRGEKADKDKDKGDSGKDDDDARDVAAKPAAGADDDTILVAVPDRSFSYEGRERVFYRARDGDSLDEIADAFGVRSEELCEWNNVDPSAKLHPKMVLQVFVRRDFDPAGVLLLDAAKVRVVTLGSEEFLELETARRGKKRLYYTAKSGDTLVKLGRRYGLTPGDLARINRFSYNTELHEGDRIVVYSPTGDAPHETHDGDDAGEEAARARRSARRGALVRHGGEEEAHDDGREGGFEDRREAGHQAGGQVGQDRQAGQGRRQGRRQEEVAVGESPAMARAPIPPDAAGQRIDHVVAAAVPGLSISAARRLLEAGAVRIDGRRPRKGAKVAPAPARPAPSSRSTTARWRRRRAARRRGRRSRPIRASP